MLQKVIKVGNSAAITIPREFLNTAKINIGDHVHVELDEATGAIVVSSKQKPFKGMSPDIAQWTKKFIDKNRQALEELASK